MPNGIASWGYGPRIDGTQKGPGFAAQTLPDGSVMTEFSLGRPDFLYPAVYQGITPWDMQTLANVASRGYDPLQQEVFDRAYQSALVRVMQGLSPFWMPSDGTPGTMRYGAAYQQILK